MLLLISSDIAFATSVPDITIDMIGDMARDSAIAGGIVGCIGGVAVSQLSGGRGKDMDLFLAIVRSAGTVAVMMGFFVATHLALIIMSKFGVHWFQYQRMITVAGMAGFKQNRIPVRS